MGALVAELFTYLHLLLTDDYLAIASKDKALTIKGIRALCGQLEGSPRGADSAGGKRSASRSQIKAELDAIRDAWLKLYLQDTALLQKQYLRESTIAKQTPGRMIIELAHSIRGANTRSTRDKKGLGLAVSLAVSDAPRVHSGASSFVFDPELTRIEIHTVLGARTPAQLPVLRLPFPFDRSREHQPVLRLLDTHDTVVVMPFRDQQSRQALVAEWERDCEDEGVLNWVPRLDRVVWQRKDAAGAFTRMWLAGRDGSVRKVEEGVTPPPARVQHTAGKPSRLLH